MEAGPRLRVNGLEARPDLYEWEFLFLISKNAPHYVCLCLHSVNIVVVGGSRGKLKHESDYIALRYRCRVLQFLFMPANAPRLFLVNAVLLFTAYTAILPSTALAKDKSNNKDKVSVCLRISPPQTFQHNKLHPSSPTLVTPA